MKSLATKRESHEAVDETGTVVRMDGDELVVRTRAGDLHARRAASCLLEPQLGDLVRVYAVPDAGAYILDILERDERKKARLACDGDVELRVRGGRLTVAADEGIDLVTGKDVAVTAGALGVNAIEGRVVLERLSFLGGYLLAEIERARVLATTFDSVLERFSQRVKRSYRFVEELDQVRAGRIDMTAKENLRLHAENALVTANELVKLDGEQIHVG